MASLIDSLLVKIGMDTGPLKAGATESASLITTLTNKVGGLGVGLAALAGVASFAAITSSISSAIDRIDELGASAAKIGVTTEALSALQFAAGQSDVELGTLQGGLQKLNLTLGQAVGGSDKAAEAFSKIGLNAQALSGVGTTQAFAAIAEKISQIKSPAEQAAAAVAIFGKSGAELLPLLKVGGAGIDELTARAEELGLVMSGDQVDGIKTAKDAIDELGSAWDGVFNNLAALVAPILTSVFKTITDFVTGTRKVFTLIYDTCASVFKGIANLLRPLTEPFVKFVEWVWNLFDGLFGDLVQGFVDAFNFLARKFGMDEITNPFSKAASKLNADTSSITAGIEAMSEGMNTAEADADALAKKLEQISGKVEQLTADWQTQIETQGMNSRQVEIHKLKALGANDAQIASLEELNKKLTEQEDKLKRQKELEAFDDMAAGWQKQIDTIGLAGRALDIYNAKANGATDEQIKKLEELDKALSAQEDKAKSDAEGKALFESLMTPYEKYQKEVEKINKLVAAGSITEETANRARMKALKDMESADGTSKVDKSSELGGLSAFNRFNSVEAFSALQRASLSGGMSTDPMDKLATQGEKEIALQGKTVKLLERIADSSTSTTESFL